MKRLSSAIILLLLFFCFFFYACPKKNPLAPEVPEQPIPQFNLVHSIKPWPLVFDFDNWYEGLGYVGVTFVLYIWSDNPRARQSEANLSSVKASMYIGNTLKVEKTQVGVYIKSWETVDYEFVLQIFGPDYKVDKLTIEIKGVDNTGNPIDEKIEKIISWNAP